VYFHIVGNIVVIFLQIFKPKLFFWCVSPPPKKESMKKYYFQNIFQKMTKNAPPKQSLTNPGFFFGGKITL